MAFASRQTGEIFPTIEVSTVALTPGAVTSGGTNAVGVVAACTVNAQKAATFALGDLLFIIPSTGANINGVVVAASPTATIGSAEVVFTNVTGGSITPTAGATYTVIAIRLGPNFF